MVITINLMEENDISKIDNKGNNLFLIERRNHDKKGK